jgi:dienelactone hydrolase
MQVLRTSLRAPLAVLLLVGLTMPAVGAEVLALETVTFSELKSTGGDTILSGYLVRPMGTKIPAPAVVALHGCGGLFTRNGQLNAREQDWAARWRTAGYAVLFPDSFGSRGQGSQCQSREREIVPRLRAQDAAAAADWLASQPFVDKAKLAAVGWSHGGSTVLWTVRTGFKPANAEFKTAIAFYPGCRVLAEQRARWTPRLPLTVLIGGADDWTPPEPCRDLDRRHGMAGDKTAGWHYAEYPGAYHAFDAPNTPVQVRTGLAYSKSGDGRAHVGTDPVARAKAIDTVMKTLAEAFK